MSLTAESYTLPINNILGAAKMNCQSSVGKFWTVASNSPSPLQVSAGKIALCAINVTVYGLHS